MQAGGDRAKQPGFPAPGLLMDRAADQAADLQDAAVSIVGVVDRVIFSRPETGWRVIRVNVATEVQPVVVVGTLPDADTGEILRAEGSWYFDRIWGRQFRAMLATLEPPATEEGLVAYLASGRIKGMGEVLARRLVARFGAKLGDVVERHPERLREIPGMGQKLLERLQGVWSEQRQQRDAVVFLSGKGLSTGRAGRVLQAYGDKAIERVSADPYAMVRDVRGIGFATADEVAGRLGIEPDSPSASQPASPRCCESPQWTATRPYHARPWSSAPPSFCRYPRPSPSRRSRPKFRRSVSFTSPSVTADG